jgi:4-hydroxythreonine-4-phosphate dehydrogenase
VSSEPSTRRLLITPGEPAGIGPDVTLTAAMYDHDAEIFAIADPDLLQQRAKQLNIDVTLNIYNKLNNSCDCHKAGSLNVLPISLETESHPGTLKAENSAYVLGCIKKAAEHCLEENNTVMVTGPVHKGIINEAGFNFTGHTEFLADLAHSKPVMMLATESLRVALATTHLPLSKVSEAITPESLQYTIRTLNTFLHNNCHIQQPTLLVCGLNPHAGENGFLGQEEQEIIIPVLEKCRDENIKIIGPLPADTAFTQKYLAQADAILAMYHDQGLPVLKYSGFGKAVNITLGLPFIRTSVDHGTAIELAGSGRADEGSMLAALNMAINLNPH